MGLKLLNDQGRMGKETDVLNSSITVNLMKNLSPFLMFIFILHFIVNDR